MVIPNQWQPQESNNSPITSENSQGSKDDLDYCFPKRESCTSNSFIDLKTSRITDMEQPRRDINGGQVGSSGSVTHNGGFRYDDRTRHINSANNSTNIDVNGYCNLIQWTRPEETARAQVLDVPDGNQNAGLINYNGHPPASAGNIHRNARSRAVGSERRTNAMPSGNVPHIVRDASYQRADFVDGDEPGIDPELERLTQPHTVLTQPRYQRFAEEEVRKRTFATWTNRYPSVMLLVLSGFFFLGGRDSVQCFHCGIILHSWEESDIPDEEHKKHSPDCVYLRLKNERHRTTGTYQQVQNDPTSPRVSQQTHEVRIMQTVAGLGHSMTAIEKAMDKLKLSGKQNIDTSMLVDAVFDIENDEDYPEREPSIVADYSSEGAIGGSPQGTTMSGNVGQDLSHLPQQENQPQIQEDQQQMQQQEQIHQQKMQQQQQMQHQSQHRELDEETKGIIEKAKQLEKENEDLRKQTTCRVCFENPATEVFLPCGHLACCENCSGRLTECPYCRKKIMRTVHVYLP